MEPNNFIKKLREYPLVSHKAWEAKDKSDILKMDWNEADVRVPEAVKKAVIDFVGTGPLQWYPDVANKALLEAIAKYAQVSVSHVQYFVGEDSALDYLVRTFVANGDEVGLVAPTYDNFRVFVESVGAIPRYLTTANIFAPDISTLMKLVSPQMKMVYLVNPNNPTGVLYPMSDIQTLIEAFPSVLFVLDEAYSEFAGSTAMPLVETHKNIVVGRSLSKAFGLASFRLGYIATTPENLAHLNKIRNGKSVSALGQIAVIEALKNPDYVTHYVEEVRAARQFLKKELTEIGFAVRETPANFILLEVADPARFCAALATKNVFIRSLSHLQSMEHYVRITVGNTVNAKKLIFLMKELIKHGDISTD